MSVERDEAEFQRYLEYQRARRQPRVETLGGVATALVLSTIDLGMSEVADPASEAHETAESDQTAEVIDLRSLREHKLAGLATDHAELGYAEAA